MRKGEFTLTSTECFLPPHLKLVDINYIRSLMRILAGTAVVLFLMLLVSHHSPYIRRGETQNLR